MCTRHVRHVCIRFQSRIERRLGPGSSRTAGFTERVVTDSPSQRCGGVSVARKQVKVVSDVSRRLTAYTCKPSSAHRIEAEKYQVCQAWMYGESSIVNLDGIAKKRPFGDW